MTEAAPAGSMPKTPDVHPIFFYHWLSDRHSWLFLSWLTTYKLQPFFLCTAATNLGTLFPLFLLHPSLQHSVHHLLLSTFDQRHFALFFRALRLPFSLKIHLLLAKLLTLLLWWHFNCGLVSLSPLRIFLSSLIFTSFFSV